MKLIQISFKNMVSRPLNAMLSILLLALSVSLICVAFQLQKAFSQEIGKNTKGIDMVVGAKGSPLQLILASVLHIDSPTGNIDFAEAKKIAKNPLVKNVVPISYGDNYKGYRIIGSTTDFAKIYKGILAEGRDFQKPFEVVLGAGAAKTLNLKLDDTFVSAHGLVKNSLEVHKEHKLVVVGILAETRSVLDNLIVTPLETVWELHGHHHDGEHDKINTDREEHGAATQKTEGSDHPKEITALLVKFRNPLAQLRLPRQINATTNMQAALTGYELERLFNFTGIGVQVIGWIAVAILIISVFSIFIGLYRIVRDRRYELALMRVYGASRVQLLCIVLYEGFLLSILGYALGWLLSKMGLYIFKGVLDDRFKFDLVPLDFQPEELYLLLALCFLVILATLMATLPLFKLNVSKILTDES